MSAVASPGISPGSGPDPEPEPEPEEPQRARRSVLAPILLAIPVLAAAAGVYLIVTHKFMPQPARTTYQVPAVFNLRAGDCFNQDQHSSAVSLVRCNSPHDAEVFATFTLPEGPWPGVDAVQSQADAGCAARASDYLGTSVTPSSLSRNSTYPDPVTWQAGVRTVVCTISAADGSKTSGSFRAAGTGPAPGTAAAAGGTTGPNPLVRAQLHSR